MENNNQKSQKTICKRIFRAVFGRSPRKLEAKTKPVTTIPISGPVNKPVQFETKPLVKPSGSTINRAGTQMEEEFTKYIDHAKLKFRAPTNSRDGSALVPNIVMDETEAVNGSTDRQGSIDQYAEFIKRAKMKIRMTSSAGSRSMKNSF